MEKIRELLNDEAFVDKLKMTKNAREGSRLFAEYGADISAEELAMFMSSLGRALGQAQGAPLDEGQLDEVAGGGCGDYSKIWDMSQPIPDSMRALRIALMW